jgi:arylsulfatase A-like enzyme
VVNDYVSFIDFAPTFLDVAGVPWSQTGMAPITGRSLLPILEATDSTPPADWPNHVLISKERTDVGRPHDEGYPIRGMIENGMLYIHNFETNRWPGGNPETGYMDTDVSPTKTEVLKTRFTPEQEHYWQLDFGKLPADQLFDVRHDPDCLTNLAGKVSFAALQRELFTELKQQGDPRMFGKGDLFDDYPCANPRERNFFEKWMHGENF